jgi:putative NIF3 family GTP cyclohydrolase 1 type 2
MGTPAEPCAFETFARHVLYCLGGNGLKYLPAGRVVKHVAVGGGSCGSDLPLVAAAGCDTFVTADVKHAQMLEAKWYGINLIDAGHFPTEDVICPVLVSKLRRKFPILQVKRAESLSDIMSYICK